MNGDAAKKRRKSLNATILEFILIILAAVGIAVAIQAFLVKPYRIPSESMEPTLDVGQRVLVNRVNYRLHEPRRKDVVVFHPPLGSQTDQCGARHSIRSACPEPTGKRSKENFIKRIVGLPGDRLSIKNGRPIINGKPLEESYTIPCGGGVACNMPKSITIPPGHYFMMGDNRGASQDSRFWGPVPRKWIIGEAFFTYWPPRRIGPL